MVDTKLSALTLGTLPSEWYGVDTGGASKRFTALDWHNVKDFGALGDGSHDDTSAIQNAINWSGTTAGSRGVIYFPIGTYKVISTISLDTTDIPNSNLQVTLQGAASSGALQAGSAIVGNFNGFLFERTGGVSGQPQNGSRHSFRDLDLINNSAGTSSGAVRMYEPIQPSFINCSVKGYCGISLTSTLSACLVETCSFTRASSLGDGSVGLYGCGECVSAVNCDFSGYATGVMFGGNGASVTGSRFEKCGTGIYLGGTLPAPIGSAGDMGNPNFIRNPIVMGNGMEANGRCIYINSAQAGMIANNFGTGSPSAEATDGGISWAGIYIKGANGMHILGNDFVGNFLEGNYVFQSGQSSVNIIFENNNAGATLACKGNNSAGDIVINMKVGTSGLHIPTWVVVGQVVSCPGYVTPATTTVSSIDRTADTITLSAVTIGAINSDTISFSFYNSLGYLQGNWIVSEPRGNQVDITKGNAWADPTTRSTGNFTLDKSVFNEIEMNPGGGTITLTVPSDASDYSIYGPSGTYRVTQTGTGTASIAAGGGATLNGITAVGGQWKVVYIRHTSANTWLAYA